jgi:hypothetical protein
MIIISSLLNATPSISEIDYRLSANIIFISYAYILPQSYAHISFRYRLLALTRLIRPP